MGYLSMALEVKMEVSRGYVFKTLLKEGWSGTGSRCYDGHLSICFQHTSLATRDVGSRPDPAQMHSKSLHSLYVGSA